jgi:hypothetical protein
MLEKEPWPDKLPNGKTFILCEIYSFYKLHEIYKEECEKSNYEPISLTSMKECFNVIAPEFQIRTSLTDIFVTHATCSELNHQINPMIKFNNFGKNI